MKKNLPIINKNTSIILSKTKSLREITNKVLSDKISVDDDNWMQKLWDWADENEIPDLDLLVEIVYRYDNEEPDYGGILPKRELEDADIPFIQSEWWEGLPRDKNTLLEFKELYITIKDIETGIPLDLFNLINLEKLTIKYDFDRAVHNKYGKIINGIEFLNQRSEIENELKSNIPGLPIQIGKLKKLIELNLSNNELTMLPEEINNLYDLKILNLSQNKLAKLPDIFHLSALEELNLSKNELSSFPESMQNLFLLETLNISHNKLKELPDFIDHFVSLRNLDLSGNQLLKLPTSICNFLYLDRLVIGTQDMLYPDNDDLKLTQRQKIWLFDLEENGCKVDGYYSSHEGENKEYYHWSNKKIIWWECFDVWDDFFIQPTEFSKANIKKISFQTKGNIDIKDDFLAWADDETGLMWEVQNSRNINDEYLWKESFNYVSKLNSENYAGFNDWIIPNAAMLTSILKYDKTIVPVSNNHHYWSSYPFAYVDYGGTLNKVADYDGYTKELRNIRNEEEVNVICVRIFDINKALLFAVKNNLNDTVQLLLNSGAYVDSMDKEGNTSLVVASKKGKERIVQMLMNANANINHQNENGDTPLILALIWSNENIAQLLLDAGADVNIRDHDGSTPLILASTRFNINLLSKILDCDPLIDAQNIDGNTGLHLAVNNILKEILGPFGLPSYKPEMSFKMIQLFLDTGADVKLKNNNGDTVFDLLAKVDNISTVNKETIIPRLEKIIAGIKK